MLAEDKWATNSGETVSFDNFTKSTHRLALCTILSVGFGLPISWNEPRKANEDNDISLEQAVKMQGDNLAMVLFAPKWFMRLPFETYVSCAIM